MRRAIGRVGACVALLALVMPAVASARVHWIAQADTSSWDSIGASIVTPYSGPLLGGTGTTAPAGYAAKYARIVNVRTGTPPVEKSAAQIESEVRAGLNAGQYVAINEVGITTSLDTKITTVANNLGTGFANRWGVFLVYHPAGSAAPYTPFFPNYGTTINAVYANNGDVLPELYPDYHDYWRCGNNANPCTTDTARDAWVVNKFFTGPGTFQWVLDRKSQSYPGSASHIHPIFGVGTPYLCSANETNNARFIDRVFWKFVNQSTLRPKFLNSNSGGAGSYVWTASATPATRDAWFATLWVRYAVTGVTLNPNWQGAMPNPGC